MASHDKCKEELKREVKHLRERLEIAEETLRAITEGEVDALVISGQNGEQIFTLESADYPYRRFVEEMKEGAVTVNSEGMILYCNQRLMSWLNYPLEKIIGSDFKSYVVLQDQPKLQSLLQQAQTGAEKGELCLLATDGKEIPVQVSISSMMMKNVMIRGLIITSLTEQKRNEKIVAAWTSQLMQTNTQLQQELRERQKAEEALRESEAKLQAILDNIPGFVYLKDLQGRLLMVNRYCLEAWQIPSEQLIGKTNAEFFLSSPAIVQRIEAHDREVIQTGMPYQYEEEVVLADGIHTYYSVKFPMCDASGQPYAIGGISTDISDRKQSQKELELQAVITKNMAEGICLVRAADSVVVYANPKFEQMFGYNLGELNGKHISMINYAGDQQEAEDVHRVITDKVMQQGEMTYEVHNVKKDGTPFWCRATPSKFEHPDYGTVLVAVQQDITEHKQAEDIIKASLKEKEVLLKEIHHRVKNNLQIVTSLLQMQSRRTQEPRAIEVLRDSKNRITSIALVHEKLYRSDNLANIDFGQYIPDLTTHLFETYNVSSSDVTLTTKVEDISLQIDTAIPCGLIVNELVSNSLKHAFVNNQQGEIQIEFYSDSYNSLTLIVRDNGIGIPQDFDIETTQSLGLTLVQGLVEQLEGTMEIKRSRGTEFKITFPGDKQ